MPVLAEGRRLLKKYKGYATVPPAMIGVVGGGAVAAGAWRSSKAALSPAGVTTDHHDATLVYKRRARKRGDKRQIAFAKRVKKVMEKAVSSKFQTIVQTQAISSVGNRQATNDTATMLGSVGQAGIADDVAVLFNREASYERMHITGALMETMLSNIGTTTAYVDCYYWSCKKDVPFNEGSFNSMFTNGLNELTQNSPVGGSSYDSGDYGITPFQSRFITNYCSIDKKVRIKLGAGESTQLKVGRKLSYYANRENTKKLVFIRGLSTGIFFIIYGVSTTGSGIAAATAVNVVTTKNFTYKVLDTTNPTGGTNLP